MEVKVSKLKQLPGQLPMYALSVEDEYSMSACVLTEDQISQLACEIDDILNTELV